MQCLRQSTQALIKSILQRVTPSRWKPLIAETRSQILLCYIGLMTLFVGIAIPCIYQILYHEVDRRVAVDLGDEVQEFRDALIDQPATVPQMQRLMTDYLLDELIEDDQFLIFIVDEQPYVFEPEALPDVMQPGAQLMDEWRILKQETEGFWFTDDPNIGKLLYRVEPISIDTQVRGLLIIARATSDERAATDQIVRTVLLIMLAILLLAVIVAWWMSGRILNPLRSLSATARSISKSDLSKRIAVSGAGELAEVANTFNAMMDRLQGAFTSQQAFINDASHELRTPITIIQGHLDVMGNDPEEQREVLELVHDELGRMNRVVGDILTLAKAERPDFLQPEAVDLEVLTVEIYNQATAMTNCPCKLSQHGYGTVWLDPQRITQAVINLVENANQHTPATGLITLGSSRSRQHVRFWVTDTGKGINTHDQNRIFKRFARSTDQLRQSEGAGLGLSIVHSIAQASGGHVDLQSTLGKGSTFTLVLPLQSTH